MCAQNAATVNNITIKVFWSKLNKSVSIFGRKKKNILIAFSFKTHRDKTFLDLRLCCSSWLLTTKLNANDLVKPLDKAKMIFTFTFSTLSAETCLASQVCVISLGAGAVRLGRRAELCSDAEHGADTGLGMILTCWCQTGWFGCFVFCWSPAICTNSLYSVIGVKN